MTDEQIRNAVCSYFGVPMTDILSHNRRPDIVQARSALCALFKRNGKNLAQIARMINRDRATIHNAVCQGEKLPLDKIANFSTLDLTSIEIKIEDWCYDRFLEVEKVKTCKYASIKVLRNKLWRHLADLGYTQKDIANSFGVTAAAVCEQLRRMTKQGDVKPIPPKRPKGLKPGAKVWWADHDAEVLEDFGPSVKVRAFGDVYTVAKAEVIER